MFKSDYLIEIFLNNQHFLKCFLCLLQENQKNFLTTKDLMFMSFMMK